MKSLAVITAFILILVGVNYSIMQKEDHLATGEIAYLKLRPVDPRSLMQGDYMALRFELADDIKNARSSNDNSNNDVDGYVVVTLDKQNIATFKTRYTEGMKLAENETKMQYRIRGGRIKFATNAFFFQEGNAKVYEKAKYGQFRINKHGELLLAEMYDENLMLLKAKNTELTTEE